MILTLRQIPDQDDMAKLMAIYAESNAENAAYFFPDCTDEEERRKKTEAAFSQYIQNDFLAGGKNAYCVLCEDGRWVSALRLYALEGFYYMEALETAPALRRLGYGAKLLGAVLRSLEAKGPFILRDSVGKRNEASLATHKKCGFTIEHEDAVDYLDGGAATPSSYGLIYRYSIPNDAGSGAMIRQASIEDSAAVAKLALLLWPGHESGALREEMEGILSDENAAVFLAFRGGVPVGFAQCALRFDYVEGTASSPVGYLEGVYVAPDCRKQGLAKELLARGEAWAKSRGCTEFGSDCALDNADSLCFHLKAGFEEANRIICFTKKLSK